jgi:hypothetical protein
VAARHYETHICGIVGGRLFQSANMPTFPERLKMPSGPHRRRLRDADHPTFVPPDI